MSKALHWENDPVVRLEGCILPVLGAAPEILARVLAARDVGLDQRAAADLLATFKVAETQLRSGGSKFLGPTGMQIKRDDLALCITAAEAVSSVGRALQAVVAQARAGGAVTGAEAARITEEIATGMRPAVNAALDVFRRVFIGTVLERQVAQARQADAAIRQLSEISEMIFFIAVNASVEAARAGDAGRGFAVIGQDIRALSLSAREATDGLCGLMESPG